MIANVYGIFICVAGVAGLVWILWVTRHGDRDRHDEDHARLFFDEHGHWPDQTPEEAEAERRRLAASSAAANVPVAQPGPDGLV
jgi:hypothetical protein